MNIPPHLSYFNVSIAPLWGDILIGSFVKGDNRSVSNTPMRAQQTRMFNWITIETCGDSTYVASGGDINRSTRADLFLNRRGGTTWRQETGRGTFNHREEAFFLNCYNKAALLTASGRTPFHVARMPVGIDYEYTLRTRQEGRIVYYLVVGTHDAFPGHEVYLSYKGKVIDKHLYMPPGSAGDVTSYGWLPPPLFLAGAFRVNVVLQGWFIADDDCGCRTPSRFDCEFVP